MELERGGLSEGEDCSAPGEDGGFRAYCLGTSSEPWSSGWGVYVCLCDRCIRLYTLRAREVPAYCWPARYAHVSLRAVRLEGMSAAAGGVSHPHT